MKASNETRVASAAMMLACAAMALAGVFPIGNPDTFGHLAQGRQIAELGYVPTHDSFSFFRDAPEPWRNYEWLSDLLGFSLFEHGGPNALIALKCGTLAVAAGLLVGYAWLLGGARAAIVAALLLVAAIPAARFRFTERPHLVALPFTAFYYIALADLLGAIGSADDAAQRRRRELACIVSLFVVHVAWVNLHGSHLLGLAVTLAHAALRLRTGAAVSRKLALVVALQIVASCISPYGPAIALDAIEHTLNPAYRELVTEWEPWGPDDPLWFLAAPVLQTLMLAAVVRPLLRLGAAGRGLLLTSCMLAFAAFRSIRFVGDYLILSAPAIAVGAASLLDTVSWARMRVGSLAAAAAVVPAVIWATPGLPPFATFGLGVNESGVPAASGVFLARNTSAPRIFAAMEDSWYLMYAVPEAHFLVDGRVPFYGAEHVARVKRSLTDTRELDRLLVDFDVDAVVVRHTLAAQRLWLVEMGRRPGWTLAFIEDRYAVFLRADLERVRGDASSLSLEPTYDLDWLLGANTEQKRRILEEVRELSVHQNARGYVSWVRGVLALEPFFRDGLRDGLRSASTLEEAATLERAQRWLARASEGADHVPIVDAYLALVSAANCDLEVAEGALENARRDGESRETLLGAQEIALRRGAYGEVERFLGRAESMPGAQHDAWLRVLRAATAARRTACP